MAGLLSFSDVAGVVCNRRPRNAVNRDMVLSVSERSPGAIATSLGVFQAQFGPAGLERLLLPGDSPTRTGRWTAAGGMPADPRLDFLAEELRSYAAGNLRRFRTPVALRGTGFQLRVWEAVADVGYGTLTTYGEIARRIGGVARAVGAANGANPVPILIPCHRVIGSDGSLTGYGGGLPLKRRLLELEGSDLVFG